MNKKIMFIFASLLIVIVFLVYFGHKNSFKENSGQKVQIKIKKSKTMTEEEQIALEQEKMIAKLKKEQERNKKYQLYIREYEENTYRTTYENEKTFITYNQLINGPNKEASTLEDIYIAAKDAYATSNKLKKIHSSHKTFPKNTPDLLKKEFASVENKFIEAYRLKSIGYSKIIKSIESSQPNTVNEVQPELVSSNITFVKGVSILNKIKKKYEPFKLESPENK